MEMSNISSVRTLGDLFLVDDWAGLDLGPHRNGILDLALCYKVLAVFELVPLLL